MLAMTSVGYGYAPGPALEIAHPRCPAHQPHPNWSTASLPTGPVTTTSRTPRTKGCLTANTRGRRRRFGFARAPFGTAMRAYSENLSEHAVQAAASRPKEASELNLYEARPFKPVLRKKSALLRI